MRPPVGLGPLRQGRDIAGCRHGPCHAAVLPTPAPWVMRPWGQLCSEVAAMPPAVGCDWMRMQPKWGNAVALVCGPTSPASADPENHDMDTTHLSLERLSISHFQRMKPKTAKSTRRVTGMETLPHKQQEIQNPENSPRPALSVVTSLIKTQKLELRANSDTAFGLYFS